MGKLTEQLRRIPGVSYVEQLRLMAKAIPEAARALERLEREKLELQRIRMVHGDRAEKLARTTSLTIREAAGILDLAETEAQAQACIEMSQSVGGLGSPAWILMTMREVVLEKCRREKEL